MFRLDENTPLTPELIKKIVNKFQQTELPRMEKLKDYYLNKTDILKRVVEDPSKPNNKIAHPYAQYITDTLTAYFMGEPIVYTSEENIDPLKFILEYNDEQDENMELAKAASIFGRAWEMLYMDLDGSIRFKQIDSREIIPVYDVTLDNDLLYVIRFYKEYNIMKDRYETIIEVYTKTEIINYVAAEVIGELTEVGRKSHAFKEVPFVEYKNNEDNMGDFESIISLIDAYDALVSDSLNDYDYFCDAYLALYGYTADADDVKAMKENRVLLMDQGTSAEFLTKNGDSAGIDAEKTRVENDIHKFSKCPNSSDENFSGNTSGVAMKYKLFGTENLGSIKERKFKRGLQRRLELLSNILSVTASYTLDWLGVVITFTRNLPVNEDDLTTLVRNLNGVVSKKTLLSQLPFVEDADNELAQLQAEQRSSIYYAAANPTTNPTTEE